MPPLPNEPQRFESYEALVQFLKDQVDDIDCLRIPVATNPIVRQGETERTFQGGCAILGLCNFDRVIDIGTAERLINDGILQRLNVPIRLELPLAQ